MKTEAELRRMLNSTLPGLPRLGYADGKVWAETSEGIRDLGRIVEMPEAQGLCYIKNDTEAEIYRKTYAWSIPVIIALAVDQVIIQTERRTYQISHKEILQYGEKHHWKK